MKSEIARWGNSQGVRLPKHLLESAGIGEHDSVEIIAEKHCIVIKRINNTGHKTIRERFATYTGDYTPEGIDWGEAKGKEIW